MIVDSDLKELIRSYETSCHTDLHRKYSEANSRSLIHCLEHPNVASFEYVGSPPSSRYNNFHNRDMYEITSVDGRKLRLAFTHMWTVQVFSRRGKGRHRFTHCYPDEFRKRLEGFVNVGLQSVSIGRGEGCGRSGG